MDEFKGMFKEQANGIFKEKRPLVITPRSDRGGGKFDVTIFYEKRRFFEGISNLQGFFLSILSRLLGFTNLLASHF
jgi:hypothetical protein